LRKSDSELVWLRSSWEYVIAKWLDKNNLIWKYELKQFKFENIVYRPDFFIFDENNTLKQIIEVKGYWKDKVYKFYELKKFYAENISKDVELVLITEINNYTENIGQDTKLWKQIRILQKN